MNILDYYSLIREVEKDLEKQSKEIADAFINADFNPEYVSLNDGDIEENQLMFYQKIYGVIRTMISPQQQNRYTGMVKVYHKIKNIKKIDDLKEKQDEILSKYFNKTIWNEEKGEEGKNENNILELHDCILYQYEEFSDYEEEDILSVLDQYIQKNIKINNEYLENLENLFELWEEIRK